MIFLLRYIAMVNYISDYPVIAPFLNFWNKILLFGPKILTCYYFLFMNFTFITICETKLLFSLFSPNILEINAILVS